MDDLGLFKMFGAASGARPTVAGDFGGVRRGARRARCRAGLPTWVTVRLSDRGLCQVGLSGARHEEKRWRHLDFFEHQAFLVARVPRVDCAEHGVHLVAVPWARPGSGFTLLMEVAMLTFAKQMPIAPLAADGPRARHPHLAGDRAPRHT